MGKKNYGCLPTLFKMLSDSKSSNSVFLTNKLENNDVYQQFSKRLLINE